MDANSAISHFSSSLPSSQQHNTDTIVEEPEPKLVMKPESEMEQEEYETASDPEDDASDLSKEKEEALLTAEEAVKDSLAMELQKCLLENEDGVDSFSQKSESYDSALVEKKSKEEEAETKLFSISKQNLFRSDSFGADVSKNVGNSTSDIHGENDDNLSEEMGLFNDVASLESKWMEPNEMKEAGSNDTAIESKDIPGSESGAANFTASSNQSYHEEMKPNENETKYTVALDGEVLEEDKFANPHDLEHDSAIAMEPNAVEVEFKQNFKETETVQPSVDAANASESAVDAHKLEIAAKYAKLPAKPKEDCSINKTFYETVHLQNLETPESNAISSANDEDAEKGEGLVGSPAIMDFTSAKANIEKLDRVNYNEQSERNFSLNQEVDDEKMEIYSELVSRGDDGEQLTLYDGGLKSATATAKETDFGNENILGATAESLPQKCSVNNLHKLNSTEMSEGSTLTEEFSDEEAFSDLNHSTCSIDDYVLRSDAEGVTLQSTADESISENAIECLPHISAMVQKALSVPDEPLPATAKNEKNSDKKGKAVDFKNSDDPARVVILGSPEANQILREMENISSSYQPGFHGSHNNASVPVVLDSDEVLDSNEDGESGELFDSAALAALLKAATGSSDGAVTVTSQDATRVFSADRPAGLGTSTSLRPSVSRSVRPSLFAPSEVTSVSEPSSSMDDDEKKLHEKVEQIRVKFLRLVQRLGHSPEDTVATQVLYRLSLAEGIRQGRQVSRAFSIESAKKQAQQLEERKDDLEFSCNILVIGKTGVGKSATINSIFGEEKSQTNPFQPATPSVREISGAVDGVRIRVIDTPGLKPSVMDQASNRKILSSIKNFTKKCPPDIVLYVDRMDTQTRDFNDLPLLKSVTSVLGSSIWFNAIVALTHAASAPPDGPNGSPFQYEVFVTQRSHVVQQSIRQAAGDMRLMNPVALVENHPSCRRNREGERVLPNGLSWRPQLLLLSYSSKILSEANSLLKLQDPSPGKLFGFRLRSPPLPFLLSSLLQSRVHPKLSGDHGGDNADSDVDMDDLSDAEQDEEEDEYDQLPPFKPLKKAQIAILSKEQKRAYFEEYDYRVKLLQRKQLKEELRRLKENKKRGKSNAYESATGDMLEDYDQDGSPAAVQVPLPDMTLPPSFDCDNPAYRYRFLEPTSQFLTRPVLDTHGWDHDCGYDGVSIEESLAIAGQFPTSMAVQITKDKKDFNIHLDSSIAAKHGEYGSTLAGFDIQSVGKQLAYILRSETKIKNLKKNKTTAGVSVTFLGETIAGGCKLEDRISIGKRLAFVASTGVIRAQKDVAFGANLEARLRDKDYPVGQVLSTLGLSLMKWKSDLALGANLQSQFSVGRNSKMAVRVGLNNKLSGQITVKTTTSEQLQIALAGIIPLAISIYRCIRSNESYLDH